MLPIIILSLLAIVGIVLLVIELFLIPGMGIAGIAAAILLIGAVVYAYLCISTLAGHITFFSVVIAAAIAIYVFYKSRAIEKMGLDTKLEDKVEMPKPGKHLEEMVNDQTVNEPNQK